MKSRKLFIKMLAAIFAFALLTPIMSKLDANTNEVQAATTASELLNIKCQVTQGTVTETSIDKYRGNYVMRFVSSIENLDYQYVGFEITYLENEQEVTKTNKIKTVFKRIESTTGSVDGEKDTYTFSPKVISTDSEYFITAKWPVSAGDLDTEYTVRAFAKPLDGKKVYGPARTVTARDGLSTEDTTTNINMLFQNTSSETIEKGQKLTVNDIADAGEVLGVDDSNVSVRISGIDKASMKSATKYTFKKGDVTVGSEIYRYLYTKYTGDASSVDTSWYTVDSSQTKFTIATSADLYGLAKLTNSVVSPLTAMQTFSGKTIYLVSDIVVNDETLVTEGTDVNYGEWISSENTPVEKDTLYKWIPIAGNNSGEPKFEGIFDGQMHSISGIYCVNPHTQNHHAGLFARTGAATIKNFRLVNSYFMSNIIAGSVSARSWGATIENIYSNAIVEVLTDSAGGFTGYSNNITIRNSWFDGNVNSINGRASKGGLGGFIGTSYEGTVTTLNNCLYTGYVSNSNVYYTGGLVGSNVYDSSNTNGSTIYLNNCLSAGTVDVAKGGSLVGVLNGGSLTTTDTYAYGATYVVGYKQNGAKFTLISGTNAAREVGSTSTAASIKNPTEITANLTPSKFIGEVAKDNMIGFNFDTTWSIIPNENPVLTSFESVVMDTSWYDEDEDTYVLYDKADLWGFSKLSKETNFAGKTIKLGNDIVVNTGDYTTWSATNAPKYAWTPISSYNKPFAGTFDGGMYTIKGLYMNSTSNYCGLFSTTSETSIIKNLRIEDSCFTSTGIGLGSVAGIGKGRFENIYSSALVTGSTARVGGLVGGVEGTATTLRYCWYKGTVTNNGTTDADRGTGGLVGVAYGNVVVDNCLNGGTVNSTASSRPYPKTGGLIGAIEESAAGTVVNITDCLNSGMVEVASASTGGNIVGCITSSKVTCTTTYGYGVKNSFGYAQTAEGHSNYSLITKYISDDVMTTTTYTTNGVKEAPIMSNWNTSSSFSGANAQSYMKEIDFTYTWQTVEGDEPGAPVLNLSPDLENMDKRWYDASASEYVLYDKGDLYGFAALSETNDFTGKTVRLANDINLLEGNAAKWGTNPHLTGLWTPIGSTSKPFAGTFDGGMHTISGLYMSATTANSGLFGVTKAGSIVKNVKLENSYLTSTASGLGSVVGKAQGTVENVYSNAFVTGAINEMGGIVGVTTGTNVVLKKVWYQGTVTNTDTGESYKGTGGLIGSVQGTTRIENGLNNGTVDASTSTAYVAKVGGLVGGAESSGALTITECLNTGNVLTKQGKLGGYLVGCYVSDVNCYASYGYGNAHAVGYKNGAGFFYVHCYKEQTLTTLAKDQSNYSSISETLIGETNILGNSAKTKLTGFDFVNKWKTVAEGTPELNFEPDYESADTRWYSVTDAEYILEDVADLYGFAKLSVNNAFKGKTITLANDIPINDGTAADWSDETKAPTLKWTPISNFAGTFDGGMHSISGLYMSATTENSGLFGVTTADSTVKNVKLENSYLTSTASGLGSIVGKAQGTVENVYSNAFVTGSNAYIGGVVGITAGTSAVLENVWYAGTATNTGTEKAQAGIGGLIGSVQGTTRVENSLNKGTIDASKSNAWVTKAGGLVGVVETNAPLTIVSCLNTGDVLIKTSNVGGYLIGCYSSAVNCYATYGYGNDDAVGYQNASGVRFTSHYYQGQDLINKTATYGEVTSTLIEKESIVGTLASNGLKGFDFVNKWKSVSDGTPELNFAPDYESADTRWYSVTKTEYILEDVGDLYGFAKLSVNNAFKGKTIKLKNDIVVNEGTASEWADESNAPALNWTPISYTASNTNPFAGTFDGQGYTISGLYFNRTNRYAGLFAAVGASGVVKNVKLTNSYFKSTQRDFGSIVGRLDGKVYMVYSDADMSGSLYAIGGIAGFTAGTTVELENCWFDGNIVKTADESTRLGIGGIVGMAAAYGNNYTLTIRNCLNTADIDILVYAQEYPCVGGIVGRVYKEKDGTYAPQVEIDSCLNTGEFKRNAVSTKGVGPIVGFADSNETESAKESVLIYRTYATESTSGNNIFRDGLYVVNKNNITGSNAQTYMPYLGWETDWEVAETGYPEIKFSTSGYGEGAGVLVEGDEQTLLTKYYTDRTLYQGELHAHAKTTSAYENHTLSRDDGNVTLTDWLSSMATLKLDFAASLDHHQTGHFDLDVWQKSKLIYGTEAGTTITDANTDTTKNVNYNGELHYSMLFPNATSLRNVLDTNSFNYFSSSDYFAYKDFNRTGFVNLINSVQSEENGGFFIHVHPTQTTYADYDAHIEEYYFAPKTGFEVMYMNMPNIVDNQNGDKNNLTAEQIEKYLKYGAYVTAETNTHYKVWNNLLKNKARLYATAGSDTHRELNSYAVSSVYSGAAAEQDKGAIISQLRKGDFVAGAVGIQMCIGETTEVDGTTTVTGVSMGNEYDFNGKRLEVKIGKFHDSVVGTNWENHKFSVNILDNNGIVVSQMIKPNEEMNLAITTSPNSGYYRVEVYDMTLECPIAIGNPIWNQDWK